MEHKDSLTLHRFLYDLMQTDKTIIVDEIDRNIHANLLKDVCGKSDVAAY